MRNMKRVIGLGVVLVICSTALVFGQRPEGAGYGPPSWVLEAWETGEDPVVPVDGPPAWVVDAWANGEHPRANGMFGPPAWVVGDSDSADGPPAWVVDAWANGEHPRGNGGGFGPPDFVLDLLGF